MIEVTKEVTFNNIKFEIRLFDALCTLFWFWLFQSGDIHIILRQGYSRSDIRFVYHLLSGFIVKSQKSGKNDY